MIYADSRYANGDLRKANDARTGNYRLGVHRKFPSASKEFYSYTWVEGDRIDVVSNALLGSPVHWWKIMDVNPEISNPFNIAIGATIRIPRV
jgi:hypothetical protein